MQTHKVWLLKSHQRSIRALKGLPKKSQMTPGWGHYWAHRANQTKHFAAGKDFDMSKRAAQQNLDQLRKKADAEGEEAGRLPPSQLIRMLYSYMQKKKIRIIEVCSFTILHELTFCLAFSRIR